MLKAVISPVILLTFIQLIEGINFDLNEESHRANLRKGYNRNTENSLTTSDDDVDDDKKAENGKACKIDSDCKSGRCDFNEWNPYTGDFSCSDPIGNGELCMKHSDCSSGYCSFDFVCGDKHKVGEYCVFDIDCESQDCWFFQCKNATALVDPDIKSEKVNGYIGDTAFI